MLLHDGDTRRDAELRRREKHRQKPLDDQVVQLGLSVRKLSWDLEGGNDGEVIGDFFVVKNPAVWLDPIVLGDVACVRCQGRRYAMALGNGIHRTFDRVDVVLR